MDKTLSYKVSLISVNSTDIMLFFGFSNEQEFSRDEFCFFLDCLLRGLMNLTLRHKEKKPEYLGCRVKQADLQLIVKKVFPDKKDSIERQQFSKLFISNKAMS